MFKLIPDDDISRLVRQRHYPAFPIAPFWWPRPRSMTWQAWRRCEYGGCRRMSTSLVAACLLLLCQSTSHDTFSYASLHVLWQSTSRDGFSSTSHDAFSYATLCAPSKYAKQVVVMQAVVIRIGARAEWLDWPVQSACTRSGARCADLGRAVAVLYLNEMVESFRSLEDWMEFDKTCIEFDKTCIYTLGTMHNLFFLCGYYWVATISRLLRIIGFFKQNIVSFIGLFGKRDL